MAKEPKERRDPSSSRKRGSSASKSQKGRKARRPPSPSLTWAKWVEGLGELQNQAAPRPEESELTIPEGKEGDRARQRHKAARRLRDVTETARQTRRAHPEKRHAPPTAGPARPAARGRRPGASDTPRHPARPSASAPPPTSSGDETGITTDTRTAGVVQPAARPLVPQTAPTAGQKPPATDRPAASAPVVEPAPATEESPAATTDAAAEATTITAAEATTDATADGTTDATADGTADATQLLADDFRAALADLPPQLSRRRPQTALVDPSLPEGYGNDLIRLFARDPEWLFAYWEITAPNWERARTALGDEAGQARLVLRVYAYNPEDADAEESSYDIGVSGAARSWYVHAGRPSIGFEVELGLLGPGGQFVGLARSNRTTTPGDGMSPVLDEEWRCLEREYQEIFSLSGGYQVGSSSLELRELVAHRLQEVMGSGAVSSFGASEALVERRGRRGFWFVLGTELIVYGATEPNATVTCQGHPIELREDGTFSLRFALPDGKQEIPCTARSADGIDTITITPAVDKWTQREEHSQDDPAFTAHAAPGDRESSADPWRRK